MPTIKDGGRCPKNNRLVMIRSDLGCLKCEYKKRLIANQYSLAVECAKTKDNANDKT